MFDDDDIKDIIDPEPVIVIDFDDLDKKSLDEANDMLHAVYQLYYDEELMKRQPRLKKRIETDLESLRINLKMRKADEQAHDILLKNIEHSPSNASLYRALTDMQKTIINITTKIEETINNLSNLLKSYQQELPFEEHEEGEEESEDIPEPTIFKGSKAFIEAMNE